jgi:hypothetical protein
MYKVGDYVSFLKGLKDNPKQVIVAGIIGNPTPVTVGVDDQDNPELEPSCVSAAGEADPAVRLKHFLDQFPQRNTTTTICNEDLSDALILVAELLKKSIGDPCIEGDIDIYPDEPGIQYECQVSDVRYPGEDRQEETILPECENPASPTLPCWHLQEDLENCDKTVTNLALVVERGPGTVPFGTYVVARCVVR